MFSVFSVWLGLGCGLGQFGLGSLGIKIFNGISFSGSLFGEFSLLGCGLVGLGSLGIKLFKGISFSGSLFGDFL